MKPSSSTPPAPERQALDRAVVTTPTIAPQQAVQEYLNALLQDATSLAQAEELAVVETVVMTAPASLVDPVVEPAAEIAPVGQPLQPVGSWSNGRPSWAQQRFECLLFKVAGLTLAVPLVELGGVLEIEQELRALFGQPDWFLGLLPSKTAGTVKAIDTARWVMPDKRPQESSASFKYLILMGSSEWGMACHTVEEAITLEPDQVRWRGDRSRRPWLAGTVIEHMCAIMDVSALLLLLEQRQIETI